jgi:hypothetical protein
LPKAPPANTTKEIRMKKFQTGQSPAYFPSRFTALFAVMAAFSLSACGTRTETERTTIIERKIEVPVAAEPADGHLQRAGEKIDQKVGEKIDDAVDRALD